MKQSENFAIRHLASQIERLSADTANKWRGGAVLELCYQLHLLAEAMTKLADKDEPFGIAILKQKHLPGFEESEEDRFNRA